MSKLKNLATCKPTEFVKQTVKIKKSVQNWLKITDIMNIMREKPNLTKITDEMSESERQEIFDKNKEISEELARKKISNAFDAALENHPDETLELLALLCFVEPTEIDNYPIDEYFTALNEMLNNTNVISFFTSLIRLGQMPI